MKVDASCFSFAPKKVDEFIVNWSISCVFVNAVFFTCHNQVVRPTTMTQNLTVSSGEVTSPCLIAMFPSHASSYSWLEPKSHFTSLGRWSGSSRSMRFWKSLQVIVDVDVDERGWIDRWQLIPLQLLSRCPHNPQAHRQRQRSNVFSVEPKMMPLVGSQSLAMLGNLDFRIARSFPPSVQFFQKSAGGMYLLDLRLEACSCETTNQSEMWILDAGILLDSTELSNSIQGQRASYVSIFYWSRIGSESRLEHIDLKKSKIDLRSVLEYVASIPEQIWTHWWFSCFETSANCGVAFYAFYAYQSREKVFRVAISVSYMAFLFRKWDGSTVVIDGTFIVTMSTWCWMYIRYDVYNM